MSETRFGADKDKFRKLREAAGDHLRKADFEAAEKISVQLINDFPDKPDGWVFKARIAQRRNDFFGAADLMKTALEIAPDRLDIRLAQAESRIYVGRIAAAIAALNAIRTHPSVDETVYGQLSALYTQLGRHKDAYECAQEARVLAPTSLNRLYLVASAAIALGEMEEAEKLLNKIIRAAPGEGDIYYNRATLRKQTADCNHIDELQRRLKAVRPLEHREAPICYALGKELEDLGEHGQAFDMFARGARSRRARLSYDVGIDEKAAARIIETFDQGWAHNTAPGAEQEGPLIVLGLPRSGTTLVDRILSAHSNVASLGEVNDFAYGVVRAGYPAAGKDELIKNSASADMAQMGQAYWAALRGYGEPAAYLIDKTPANYLYLGLIAKAAPRARIVHVRRHPMASGYAMFKTLFRMGYPFSYSLTDVGRYYLAYDRLMAHWRRLFPDRILDIQYEELVDRQEAVSQDILSHCGLPWEEACIEFHRNTAPTATASAAQVRQPIYRDARDLWRIHEARLEPLAKILKEGGVPCH